MTFEGQDGFPSLTVAGWQHDGFMQSLVGHESFSGSDSSIKSEKKSIESEESPAVLMKQYVEEEVGVMVAALEASDISRTEAQNAGDCLDFSSANGDGIVEPVRRITNPGPPKRFRRRGVLWASITHRMLLHAQESTRSRLERSHPSFSLSFDGGQNHINQ